MLVVVCVRGRVVPDQRAPIRRNDAVAQGLGDHALVGVVGAQHVAAPAERAQVSQLVRAAARERDAVIDVHHVEREWRRSAAVGSLAATAVAFPDLLPKLLPDGGARSSLSFRHRGVGSEHGVECRARFPMPCVATPGLAIPSHRQTVPDLAMHGALAVVDEQRAEHEAPKADSAAVAEPDQPPGILQHRFKLVAADHRFIPAECKASLPAGGRVDSVANVAALGCRVANGRDVQEDRRVCVGWQRLGRYETVDKHTLVEHFERGDERALDASPPTTGELGTIAQAAKHIAWKQVELATTGHEH